MKFVVSSNRKSLIFGLVVDIVCIAIIVFIPVVFADVISAVFLCLTMALLSQESNIECQEKNLAKLFVVSGYYIKFV